MKDNKVEVQVRVFYENEQSLIIAKKAVRNSQKEKLKKTEEEVDRLLKQETSFHLKHLAMRRIFPIACLSFLANTISFARVDPTFEEARRGTMEEFENFARANQEKFDTYVDHIDREFTNTCGKHGRNSGFSWK